jgi:hypothetical protein
MSLRLCSNDERNLTNRVTLGCSFPSAVCLDCAPWRTWRRMGWAEEFFKVYHYTYSIMVSTGMRESISHVVPVRQPRPSDKLWGTLFSQVVGHPLQSSCGAPSSVQVVGHPLQSQVVGHPLQSHQKFTLRDGEIDLT